MFVSKNSFLINALKALINISLNIIYNQTDRLKCTTSVAEERLLVLDSEAPYEESMATTC